MLPGWVLSPRAGVGMVMGFVAPLRLVAWTDSSWYFPPFPFWVTTTVAPSTGSWAREVMTRTVRVPVPSISVPPSGRPQYRPARLAPCYAGAGREVRI